MFDTKTGNDMRSCNMSLDIKCAHNGCRTSLLRSKAQALVSEVVPSLCSTRMMIIDEEQIRQTFGKR